VAFCFLGFVLAPHHQPGMPNDVGKTKPLGFA
jgi:hypothetical protein